jgi:hypothetical protein
MRTVAIGLTLILAAAGLLAAGPGTLRPFSRIEVLEVENKRNAEGKKLPDEWMPRLREQLRYSAGSVHLFHRVEDAIDPKVTGEETGRVVQLQLRITDFSGASARPKVTAVAVFVDKETGAMVLEKTIEAQLYFDQSATTGAIIKLSNKLSDIVKDNW